MPLIEPRTHAFYADHRAVPDAVWDELRRHSIDNGNTIAATRAKAIATIGALSCLRVGWKRWFTYESTAAVPAPIAASVRGHGRQRSPDWSAADASASLGLRPPDVSVRSKSSLAA